MARSAKPQFTGSNPVRASPISHLSQNSKIHRGKKPQNNQFVKNRSDIIFVCDNYGKCIQENYAERKLQSGNTVIEWMTVKGCEDEDKAAILISYSSACESMRIDDFHAKYPIFNQVPTGWNNY